MVEINVKDKVYYARILETTGTYDVCDLIIRTVTDTWFVGEDKSDKRAYLFYKHDIGENVFFDRDEALTKVILAESKKPKRIFTIENE